MKSAHFYRNIISLTSTEKLREILQSKKYKRSGKFCEYFMIFSRNGNAKF